MNGRMEISASFDQAIAHTKFMLFQPFDLMKWLCLGVIIFVETLLQGGGGFNMRGGGRYRRGIPDVADGVNHARDWVAQNAAFVAAVAIMVFVVIVVLGILFLWLRSHGTMMLIRAVALDDSRIGVNWSETRERALSLFKFRLVLWAISFLVFIFVFAAVIMGALTVAARGVQEIWPYVIGLIPAILIWMCVAMAFWLVNTLLRNFVAPLMYLFDLDCLDAWRKFNEICRGNVLAVVAFLLIRFAYFIPFTIATFVSVCCTCCLGTLPVVHQTLFAPFYIFDRAFSLCLIGSIGPEFQIILKPAVALCIHAQLPGLG